MRLSVIITHYREPWEVLKPLLDSIAMQRGINWEDLEVLLVQDGPGGQITEDRFDYLPYEVTPVVLPHGGISKARNRGLELATGDYIMWCDCDDMFFSAFGLHLIFSAMEEKPDIIGSKFIEENRLVANYKLIPRENDITFVHGKAFRRLFLIGNNLMFDEKLTKHEDGAMIGMCFQLTENVRQISTPFYLWCWNPGSTMRKDGAKTALLDSYPELMAARESFIESAKAHGMDERKLHQHVIKCVLDAYYDFNKAEFNKEGNEKKITAAALAFKHLYDRYRDIYLSPEHQEDFAPIAMASRKLAYENGMIMERMTIRQFLGSIEKLSG